MYTPNNDVLKLSKTSETTTLDYLRPASFKFEISSLPRTAYTCQVASIPDMKIGNATQVAPALDIPVIGDKLEFGQLDIQFIVNEDMSNYIEIHNWMLNICGTELINYSLDDFRKSANGFPVASKSNGQYNSFYADAALFIINSKNNPIIKVNFLDVIPISLQSIPFDITNISQEPLLATATFKYRLYNIEPLN